MTLWLKQSTACNVMIGPFIDDTDGKTAEAAVAITDSNTFLSKNGGAFDVKHETTHPSHDANPGGHYIVALDTTDTNTLGRLRLAVHIAGALPVWQDFMVVTANVWDSLCSTDVLDVSMVQILGTAVSSPATAGILDVNTIKITNVAQTGRDVGASVLLSAGTGAGQLDFTSGVVKANLAQILGAAVTGTAAFLVASFTKWFNIQTPTGTVNSLPDAVAGQANGLAIVGSKQDLVDAPNSTALGAVVLAILKYDWTGITGEAARSVLNALRVLRNKVSISGTTMTVTKEDDTASAWTAELATDPDADPIIGIDPT